MTEEMKAQVDDMKDFAHQAQLEGKIKGREARLKGLEAMNKMVGNEATTQEKIAGAKIVAKDEVHNAEDKLEQAGLEVKMRARDAKVSLDQTPAKQKLDAAAIKTGDALVDAKDTVVDAFTPQQKVVEATSTRGVDITHIEGANSQVLREQQKQADRAERDAEREKELKRQKLVKDTKAAAAVAKEKVQTTLKTVADKAEVVLGKAAIGLKEKLDEYTDDRPREKVTPRLSDNGVDISSVQNARNDELQARDARIRELQKAKEPTLGEKAKASISNVVESIKESYTEATTDPPKPIFVQKTSSTGIDISHVENAANAELAAKEAKRLEAEKLAATQREKVVVEGQVIEPTKEAAAEQADTLKAKMSALGSSISRAAHKLGDKMTETWNDLAHPVPVNVHEKKSESGVDTTSIANAENDKIGESIKSKSSLLPSTQLPGEAQKKSEPLTDTVIRKTLDAGVAVREAGSSVAAKTEHAANSASYQTKIAAAEADIAAQELKQKTQEKAQEIKVATQETAQDLMLKAQAAAAKASEAAANLKDTAKEKLTEAKAAVAGSSTTATASPGTKPDFDRVNTLPVLPTASPMTPGTFDTFRANP